MLFESIGLSEWRNNLLLEYDQLEGWRISLSDKASLLNQELSNLGLQYNSIGEILEVVKEVKMYW